MDQGKKQVFPYSLRTVASSVGTMCNNRYFLQITPPQNALTIENLFTHIVFQFDVSVASTNQTVVSLGIADSIPAFASNAAYQRRIAVNKVADANRRIDLSMDLSALLKKSAPNCYIEMLLNANLSGVATIGVMEVWKADGLYTTTGIR